MSVTLLCWVFVLHFIADFLCQPGWIAKQKSEKPAILFLHTMIIFGVMLVGLVFLVGPLTALTFASCNALAHGITDMFTWKGYKRYATRRYQRMSEEEREEHGFNTIWKYPYWEDHWFYATLGFDQLLHGLALIILASRLL